MKRTVTISLIKLFAGGAVLAIISLLIGVEVVRLDRTASIVELREGSFSSSTAFHFINPLLGCEVSSPKDNGQFLPLKAEVQSFINDSLSQKKAAQVSVYFDTRDGKWLGINTDEHYSPASLLKVPNMIALFKAAEADPSILNKKFVYDGAADANQAEYFKPAQAIQPHHSYTVDELIKYMIGYSDNNTLPLLSQAISFDQFKEVYTDLGLVIPEGPTSGAVDFMTVKQYANFFRVLYNATYLNWAMSEKALSLLAFPDFPQGIEAGLPSTITVAQKFGERSLASNSGAEQERELHDCGVVYYPNHPYLLCVMTKGNNFDTLANTIQGISRLVYQFMHSQYPSN